MSELRLLSLLARCPYPAVHARRLDPGGIFPLLGRLERRGYVFRRGELCRLTALGKRELELALALNRITARALAAG